MAHMDCAFGTRILRVELLIEEKMNNLNFSEYDENIDGIHLLSRTIESFNGAAYKFETYYRHLEKRVEELDLELEKKNVELRKNLKEKEEAQNYLGNILESLTTGVVVIDLDGHITTFNRAAEKITGLKSDRMLEKDFEKIFLHNLFPELRLEPGLFRNIKQHTDLETQIMHREKNMLYVSLSTFPVENPRGEKIGMAFTMQDITQLKKLEQKATRTDKLAAMGQMAAEIAHEIRNPLGSIELFATTLKRDLEGAGELQSLTEHISSGVRNLNNIISNLLLFVNPQQLPDFNDVDVISLLNESLCLSKHLIESNTNIELITQYSDDMLEVKGDPELMKQAFMNLILNAVQAMPQGGRLTVAATMVHESREKGSEFVEIQICDTGNGIVAADKSKIFDPFFTTKTKGTGLGLAIVHNILKIHNADIDIESPEKGRTECTIRFPVSGR